MQRYRILMGVILILGIILLGVFGVRFIMNIQLIFSNWWCVEDLNDPNFWYTLHAFQDEIIAGVTAIAAAARETLLNGPLMVSGFALFFIGIDKYRKAPLF